MIDQDEVAAEVLLLIIKDARRSNSIFTRLERWGGNHFEIVTANGAKFRIGVARILEGDNEQANPGPRL